MIKGNVLRKNLVSGEISYGNVDTEFEKENLSGNIIKDNPWIEIIADTIEYKDYFQNVAFIEAKNTKIKQLEDAYNNAQKILIQKTINNKIITIATFPLKGDTYRDFQIKAATCKDSGIFSFGSIIISLTKEQFLYLLSIIDQPISVKNLNIKNNIILSIDKCNSIDQLNNIVIDFVPIQSINIDSFM